jgi:hypothetical protein
MNIFDRLSRGPAGLEQSDYRDWNDMVGAAPKERFGRATYDAIRKVPSGDYYEHTQPGVGGTDPYGGLPAPQRKGLVRSILDELFRRGLGQDEISRGAHLGSLDPDRMSPNELASLTQWMHQNHPKAFGRVAAQYQDQPGILQSLLGNKALMAVAAGLGAKILADQSRKRI